MMQNNRSFIFGMFQWSLNVTEKDKNLSIRMLDVNVYILI